MCCTIASKGRNLLKHPQFTPETDETRDRQTTGHRNNTNNRLSLPNARHSQSQNHRLPSQSTHKPNKPPTPSPHRQPATHSAPHGPQPHPQPLPPLTGGRRRQERGPEMRRSPEPPTAPAPLLRPVPSGPTPEPPGAHPRQLGAHQPGGLLKHPPPALRAPSAKGKSLGLASTTRRPLPIFQSNGEGEGRCEVEQCSMVEQCGVGHVFSKASRRPRAHRAQSSMVGINQSHEARTNSWAHPVCARGAQQFSQKFNSQSSQGDGSRERFRHSHTHATACWCDSVLASAAATRARGSRHSRIVAPRSGRRPVAARGEFTNEKPRVRLHMDGRHRGASPLCRRTRRAHVY